MDASNEYPLYFKYLEVNFTVPVEEPPKIYFQTLLKNGRKYYD